MLHKPPLQYICLKRDETLALHSLNSKRVTIQTRNDCSFDVCQYRLNRVAERIFELGVDKLEMRHGSKCTALCWALYNGMNIATALYHKFPSDITHKCGKVTLLTNACHGGLESVALDLLN